VRSLQEILAPSQQARSLDLLAVVMCLYNGVAYDAYAAPAYTSVPLELRRREVAFAQPESWTDDGYRLTMRVTVRSTAIATPVDAPPPAPPQPRTVDGDGTAASVLPDAIPVVAVADDDVVFGLNFSATTVSLDHDPSLHTNAKRRIACLRSLGVAFPGSYLNFPEYFDANYLRVVSDGVRLVCDGNTSRAIQSVEVTLDLVHAKEPVLFVLAVNSQAVKVLHTTTYQTFPGGDLFHTVTQYAFNVIARGLLQVVILPGSAAALEGSSLTIREPSISSS
jgi:hypothetical protein